MISFIIAHWPQIITSLIAAAIYAHNCHLRSRVQLAHSKIKRKDDQIKLCEEQSCRERSVLTTLSSSVEKLEKENSDLSLDNLELQDRLNKVVHRVNSSEPRPLVVRRKVRLYKRTISKRTKRNRVLV